MNEHTEGPWTIGQRVDDLVPGAIEINAEGHTALALVIYEMEDDRGHTDDLGGSSKCRANAHLIAAAPDLLKVVEAFLKYDNDCHTTEDDITLMINYAEMLKEAKAAYKKAKGE